ncbi:MAG: class I SAM-dependent methyltransferase [Bacteroidia bacterium]|nr:class I SAM-dependent methyltransferase [Bacteroidia bacterium]
MTEEELNILTSESVRSTIRENLKQDPASFALSQKNNSFPTALVSTQLKYLQRAKSKLPSYYNKLCIIPPVSYEQASSEAAAKLKSYAGKRCLDLTMGLGVDALHFSHSFDEVLSVETNLSLVQIGKINFKLLDRQNINIIHQSAETFLKAYNGPVFDLIYLDPARRDQNGRRINDLKDCQPNVFELIPLLYKHASKVVIKASPLYDVNEARKKIPSLSRISVNSIQNEVKELILEAEPSIPASKVPQLEVVTSSKGKASKFSFEWGEVSNHKTTTFDPPQFLYEPDVAFYKIRKVSQLFSKYFKHLPGNITHEMGFFLSSKHLEEDFPGRIFRILATISYKPKEIKRFLKSSNITKSHVVARNFPFPVSKIRKDLKLAEGGDIYLIATKQGKKNVVFATERLL